MKLQTLVIPAAFMLALSTATSALAQGSDRSQRRGQESSRASSGDRGRETRSREGRASAPAARRSEARRESSSGSESGRGYALGANRGTNSSQGDRGSNSGGGQGATMSGPSGQTNRDRNSGIYGGNRGGNSAGQSSQANRDRNSGVYGGNRGGDYGGSSAGRVDRDARERAVPRGSVGRSSDYGRGGSYGRDRDSGRYQDWRVDRRHGNYSWYYSGRGYNWRGYRGYSWWDRIRFGLGISIFGGDPYYYDFDYRWRPRFNYGYSLRSGYSYGGVAFQVDPAGTEVYIDGEYIGVVNEFYGEPVPVLAGYHRVELFASGYEPVGFDVNVLPGQVIPYRGNLYPSNW